MTVDVDILGGLLLTGLPPAVERPSGVGVVAYILTIAGYGDRGLWSGDHGLVPCGWRGGGVIVLVV